MTLSGHVHSQVIQLGKFPSNVPASLVVSPAQPLGIGPQPSERVCSARAGRPPLPPNEIALHPGDNAQSERPLLAAPWAAVAPRSAATPPDVWWAFRWAWPQTGQGFSAVVLSAMKLIHWGHLCEAARGMRDNLDQTPRYPPPSAKSRNKNF